MRQIAVKGDVYLIWEDTYKDPAKKIPPPPDPLDPNDQNKYSYPPYYDPLYNVDELDKPNTGEEFVFCQGKPVVIVGYIFSKCKKETYRREWELDDDGYLKGTHENPEDKKHKDPDGKLIPPYKPGKRTGNGTYKDDKADTDEVDIWAIDGVEYVFVDDIPMSCMNGGVGGAGVKWAIIDGKKEIIGNLDVTGEFTECFGHVYFDD